MTMQQKVITYIQNNLAGREFTAGDVKVKGASRSSVNALLSMATTGRLTSTMASIGFDNIRRVDRGVYVYDDGSAVEPVQADPVVELPFSAVVDEVATTTILTFDEISNLVRPQVDDTPDVVVARAEAARAMLRLVGARILQAAR